MRTSSRQAATLFLVAIAGGGSRAQAPLFEPVHQMLPARGYRSLDVVLEDLDGDGDLDALVAQTSTLALNGVSLLLNDGSGRFEFGLVPDVATDNFFDVDAVAVGDLDGDSDPDVFLGLWDDPTGAANVLLINNGLGVFSAVEVALGVESTRDVDLGDVDGDGDLDALVVNEQSIEVLQNAGGGFSASMPLGDFGGLELGVAGRLADVDSDGDLDALVLLDRDPTGTTGPLLLYLNDGTGDFSPSATVEVESYSRASDLDAGDLDGDGDLDLYVSVDVASTPLFPAETEDRLYLNDGAGSFTLAPSRLPADGFQTPAAALLDADADGDLDVLRAGTIEPATLLLNDGTGSFTPAAEPVTPGVTLGRALAVGDVDGDGDPDAYVAAEGQDRLLLGNGAGSLVDTTGELTAITDDTRVAVFGDLDGDGDTDAVVRTPGQGRRVLLNDGEAAFEELPGALPPVSYVPSFPQFSEDVTDELALGDVDSDGDLDLLEIRWITDVHLFLNDGSATFTESATVLPEVEFPHDVALIADLDEDGDNDLFISSGSSTGALWLNDGAGNFVDRSEQVLANDINDTRDIAAGDLNGDGDLDLFLGNGNSFGFVPNQLLGNVLDATFVDVSATHLSGDTAAVTQAVAIGDVDGDGDLDLYAANGQPFALRQDQLMLNDGTGVFSDATANLPIDFDRPADVEFADLDEDGDLDVVLSLTDIQPEYYVSEPARAMQLYRNDGTGVFTEDSTSLDEVNGSGGDLALADLDLDGDVDVYATHLGQDYVFLNRTVQASWRAEPRIDKPLVLDLAGPPNGAWFLSVAAAPVEVPLPAGLLQLDPLTLVTLGAGALDAGGRATWGFVVNDDPSLVGATGFWQALVFPPFRFSNLERTTFSEL